MATKRVLAHFMHEYEMAAAMGQMSAVTVTDSYLLGEIDEQDIPKLQAKGLIVQVLEEPGRSELTGPPVAPGPGARLPGRRGGLPARRPIDLTRSNFYLIQLKGPLVEEWRTQLEAQSVTLIDYVPSYGYTAKLSPTQVSAVSALSFVSGVGLWGAEDTAPARRSRRAMPVTGARGMLTYEVRLHQEGDLQAVLDQFRSLGISIAGAAGRKIRFYLLEGSPLSDQIAAMPEVAAMQEYVPPKLACDVARRLMGIDPAPAPAVTVGLPQTGAGEIVAVADTGLDDSHPDFQGRIKGLVALGRSNDPSDPHGHGTHVAGSVLGSGAASGGLIRGAAPGATLFFQSLLDANGELGGLPLHLADLFDEAYQAGARIHNNSWDAATQSMYTFNSSEVDEFVQQKRDMLIVIAAGNEGSAAKPRNSRPGFVDWLSIGSPASCKNGLTVGASRSSRVDGGLAKLTYSEAWPDDFPDPPIAQDTVSGNPEAIAAFSSRGPCDDRRIKPDLVAPGTDIASTKSSRAPLRNFWGPYPGNGSYAFMGGTSMAAPLVAGAAALVREYFVKSSSHQPSAALLKAALINGTRSLTGADALADHPTLPNYHQGFGAIYLPWTIPNPSAPNLKLEFVDNWQDTQKQFNRTGQRFRFQFSTSGGEPLRITMAYTDLPARGLQNNINLFVQHVQSGQKWMGNADLPMSLKIPDPDNNVEVVRLDDPPAGDYLIQISATNLLQGGQDFALVVTGALSSSLVPV